MICFGLCRNVHDNTFRENVYPLGRLVRLGAHPQIFICQRSVEAYLLVRLSPSTILMPACFQCASEPYHPILITPTFWFFPADSKARRLV